MLGQAGAVSELGVLLHLAELIPGYDRLLEILGSDDDSLCKVVKHLAGKRLVLTQKISDLDTVRVAPVLIRQFFKALPTTDV